MEEGQWGASKREVSTHDSWRSSPIDAPFTGLERPYVSAYLHAFSASLGAIPALSKATVEHTSPYQHDGTASRAAYTVPTRSFHILIAWKPQNASHTHNGFKEIREVVACGTVLIEKLVRNTHTTPGEY